MHFPKFWVRDVDPAVSSRHFECWGWSDQSEDEARQRARARSVKVHLFIAAGRHKGLNKYEYGPGAMREQVMETIHAGDGQLTPAAIITRNRCGCLVLNSARVMFVDIDIPQLEGPEPGTGGIFGFFKAKGPKHDDLVHAALDQVEKWTREKPDWNWRVYRTRAGLRLMATHDLFEPTSAASSGLFEELGADPLYKKLCVNQSSFRARLTPKPWRIGHYQSRLRWPFRNSADEQKFAKWLTKYEEQSKPWATCRFLRDIGNRRVNPEAQKIVAIHDEMSRAAATAELA
jgi:hypothetical protein